MLGSRPKCDTLQRPRRRGDVKQYATFAAPTAGFVEQVFCIEPYSDSSGTTIVALVNKAKNRAVSIQYQTNALPYLTCGRTRPPSTMAMSPGSSPAPTTRTTEISNDEPAESPSSRERKAKKSN